MSKECNLAHRASVVRGADAQAICLSQVFSFTSISDTEEFDRLPSPNIAGFKPLDDANFSSGISQAQESAWANRNEHQIERATQVLGGAKLCLFRQKIVALSEAALHRQPHYYELLLRWIDRQGHLIFPMAVIPAAEHYKFMPLIDRWVIQTFFEYGKSQPNLFWADRYSINLSEASLHDPAMIDFIQFKAKDCSISPRSICFEITETAAIASLESAQQSVHKLQRLGYRLAVTNFGRQIGSLTCLRQLPIEYLKIDSSLTKTMHLDCAARVMVDGFNTIAHAIGIQTVAEYIETAPMLATAKQLSFDYGQGYAVALPHQLCRGYSYDGRRNF